MRQLPAVGASARSGRFSTEHLRSVSDCVQRHSELATMHEQGMARTGGAAARGRLPAWRPAIGSIGRPTSPARIPQMLPARTPREVHRLHLFRTFEGWLRLDGLFAPDDARLVEAVLDAGLDRALRAAHDGDPSVTGQPVSALRAAALVDLAAQAMRREPSDSSVPDRYRVAVVIRPGGVTEPGRGGLRLDRLPGRDGRRKRDPRRRPPDRPLAARHPSCHHRPRRRLRVPPTAIDHRHGRASITAFRGTTVAAPPSTTARSSAAAITPSSTSSTGGSRSTGVARSPEDPMARLTPSSAGIPASS